MIKKETPLVEYTLGYDLVSSLRMFIVRTKDTLAKKKQ